MATNASLKNQLATKNQKTSDNKPANPANTIAHYLKKMGPEIEKALPKHMDPDRMARIALTTIRTNPKLLEASVPSLLGAVMQAAQLGLEPGLIGHCYLVPFKNGKTGQTDVQFIIGYKGMIDLARRSGQIQNIYAHAVYEKDEFEYELGLEPKLKHKPSMEADRGEMIGVYAVAHFKDGGYQFEFMPKEEIEKRRRRSKAANNGPWVTDYEEMAKKTVIRHMWKYLPISVEIQQAAAHDETYRRDVTDDPKSVYEDAIDVEFSVQNDLDEQPEETQKEEKDELPFD
ncbi:recombination protein RecT [Caenibacillus caldisaponilyticus]|uniref:recombination protein RecT n=1 Tax=Caenibacillus caldisaponilyticus TaxID=1674942 RepID=UPI00098877A9|nr:recombination protein RecT [Caenibacillus caldisaponilyticus]